MVSRGAMEAALLIVVMMLVVGVLGRERCTTDQQRKMQVFLPSHLAEMDSAEREAILDTPPLADPFSDPFSDHYTPLTNQRINLPHQPLAKTENGPENGSLELDYKTMALLAFLPLDCIHKEFPHQVNQVMLNGEDLKLPKENH